MRPGAADRLGLGYDAAVRANPRIIYILACAYGRVGPMAREAGIDPTVQAFSGWCSITGPDHGRGEMFRHLAHIDLTTATVVTQAALQGLLARERTGKGQLIEVEMLRAAMAIQTTRLAEYFATGAQPQPLGSAASVTVPHQAFLCADHKYLAVGVVCEDQWPRFCRALHLETLIEDPRLSSNRDRVTHRDELIPVLADRFRSKPAAWWNLRLTHERVPNGLFLDFQELRYHPQARASGGITEIDTPHWGRLSVDGLPWKFELTPAGPIRAGGLPGEQAAEILAELGVAKGEAN